MKKEQIWQIVDILVFAVLGIFCLLAFYQPDLAHTSGSSISLLNGHIWDFYDHNEMLGVPDSYMPSTYLLFAVWNIPVRLFGLVKTATMDLPFGVYVWGKFLPVLVYLASAFLVRLIALELSMGEKKARLLSWLFLTTPIAFYSQFIFCQYDIFTVFFMLLGLLMYFKNRDWLFILFFGISITFKYFSLAIFVPLLLMKEKNVFKIAGKTFLVMIPIALEVLFYWHSASFKEYVLGFSVLGYLTEGEGSGGFSIPWNLLIAAGICLFAWIRRFPRKEELASWGMFLCSLMSFAVFGFMFWHPQWLLFFVPFWILALGMSKYPKVLMAFDVAFMLVFVMYLSCQWFRELDQGLLSHGIFERWMDGQIGTELMMKDVFPYQGTKWLNVGMTMLMAVGALLRFPAFSLSVFKEKVEYGFAGMRVRFLLGISIFLIPCGASAHLAMQAPYCSFNGEDFAGEFHPLSEGHVASQVIQFATDKPEYLEFYAYDWNRANTAPFVVTVVDGETEEVLLETSYDTTKFPNRGWIRMDLTEGKFEADKVYRVDFTSPTGTPDNAVSLYHTHELTDEERGFVCVLNGEVQAFDISMKIFEGERP